MAIETRPDPDALLARVKAEEARARRGRLRIFFGATAGVGKTFAMLSAAQAAHAAGAEIVSGYVEPHGRAETEALLEGLERLPTLSVAYRGVVRHAFDLDTALKRRPDILLVDELAHSNLVGGEPPPRHPKRWQDVEELLDAGISVWTTLNVQHLESLNDLVAQITGVKQRETLPDRIFDEADEVELIDLPPDDLLARLHAGKVYVPEQVAAALDRFFRKPNLIALRELALRRMTDRVEAAARVSLAGDRTSREWLAQDRLLVAVGPDAQAEQLVRAGKRLADALRAKWTVVYVETPALLRLSEQERDRRIDLLRLAESLGAETVTLDGPTAAAALIEYAQTRGATRIIVGAPKRRGWRALWRRSTATASCRRQRLRRRHRGEPGGAARRSAGRLPLPPTTRNAVRWKRYPRGCRDLGGLHGDRVRHVPVPRALESRDGVSARRRRGRAARRPTAVGADCGLERAVLRLLLRAAAFHLCGVGRAIPAHVRRHADDRARHRDVDGAGAPADARCGRTRASHGLAVCDEP
jgi:K+-sensing histidine kinase KdpD